MMTSANSPIHEIFKNKAKSLEGLDTNVEAELRLSPVKKMRLDADFDSIAEEQEKISKNDKSSKLQVLHLGNIACDAELHFDHFRKEYEKASEEVLGQFWSVIGQGRIMIARKVKFATLVENCELQLGGQKTTCMDFWDMVYFQVRFEMSYY